MRFEDLKKQQKSILDLVDQADYLISMRDDAHDGDVIDYTFVGEIFFQQQDNTAQDIIFQVPENQDFFARRMGIYPAFRFNTTNQAVNGVPEISFRPCILTSTMRAFAGLQGFLTDRAAVDAFISLTETFKKDGKEISRSMQNMPTPAQLFYSAPVNYRATDLIGVGGTPRYYPSFEFPSAMLFPKDYMLPAGSSLTCKVAPSFAGVRSEALEPGGDTTLVNDYRITVTLEGYKRVRQ